MALSSTVRLLWALCHRLTAPLGRRSPLLRAEVSPSDPCEGLEHAPQSTPSNARSITSQRSLVDDGLHDLDILSIIATCLGPSDCYQMATVCHAWAEAVEWRRLDKDFIQAEAAAKAQAEHQVPPVAGSSCAVVMPHCRHLLSVTILLSALCGVAEEPCRESSGRTQAVGV